MATIEELKDVLKETLDDRGILNKIRAQIRAEIFNTLNEQSSQKKNLSEENLIINEIFREYLEYNNYHHTKEVFIPETGQPVVPPFRRDYIAKRLKIVEDSKSQDVPLIYALVFGVKKLLNKDMQQEKEFQRFKSDYQDENYDQEGSKDAKGNLGKNIFQ